MWLAVVTHLLHQYHHKSIGYKYIILIMNLNLVSKAVVNIALLSIYVCFFGIDVIVKYLQKGVIIINKEEIPSSISPPGDEIIYLELL